MSEATSVKSRPSCSVASEMASRSLADNIASLVNCKSVVQWMDLTQDCGKDLVILNVYHVTNIRAVELLNRAGHAMGYGAYHVAVEIFGREYSYGVTTKGTGLTSHKPRKNMDHRFHGSINLGKTMVERSEQIAVLKQLRRCPSWQGKNYHSLNHNCVHFAETLAYRLGVGPIPAFLKNLADLGVSLTSLKSLWTSYRCIAPCNRDNLPYENIEILVDPIRTEEVEIHCAPATVLAMPAVPALRSTISEI